MCLVTWESGIAANALRSICISGEFNYFGNVAKRKPEYAVKDRWDATGVVKAQYCYCEWSRNWSFAIEVGIGHRLFFMEFATLDQLRAKKKASCSVPNNFLFSAKGMVDYDKLDLAEFSCSFLEFCKEQPELSKAWLLKHLQLLMERAITYSWSSVRNFHLAIHNAVEQGGLTWTRRCRGIWSQILVPKQRLGRFANGVQTRPS